LPVDEFRILPGRLLIRNKSQLLAVHEPPEAGAIVTVAGLLEQVHLMLLPIAPKLLGIAREIWSLFASAVTPRVLSLEELFICFASPAATSAASLSFFVVE
jgi:hypothetical protein